MTTRIGRPTRSEKPRHPISTAALLAAVDQLGPHWPARFADHEIVDVNEAVDRELLAGTLVDAVTLSGSGRRLVRAFACGHDLVDD
ncbi:MAG TPA: hypothetical protein VF288_03930 [Mycobacteriales bacterium]